MKNYYIVIRNQACAIRLLVAIGLIILIASSCSDDPTEREVIEEKDKTIPLTAKPTSVPIYPDTVKTGYDFDICALSENDWHPVPERHIKLHKNLKFELYNKGKLKAKGTYKVKNDKTTLVFESENFKGTYLAIYEPKKQTWKFWVGSPPSLFVLRQDYLKAGEDKAQKQLSNVVWSCEVDSLGKGYLILENLGEFKWDSLVICINGDFFDGHYRIQKNFETHEYRWPQREGTWARVNLAPANSLKMNLSEAVNPDGQRFNHTLYAVTNVCCVGKASCDGSTITTEIIQLPPAKD